MSAFMILFSLLKTYLRCTILPALLVCDLSVWCLLPSRCLPDLSVWCLLPSRVFVVLVLVFFCLLLFCFVVCVLLWLLFDYWAACQIWFVSFCFFDLFFWGLSFPLNHLRFADSLAWLRTLLVISARAHHALPHCILPLLPLCTIIVCMGFLRIPVGSTVLRFS